MDLTNKIQIAGKTDTGMVRDHNEDAIGAEITQGLVILADGMGGYKAGEVASEMAIKTVLAEFKDKYKKIKHNNADEYSAESILLRDSIELANKLIYQSSTGNPDHNGMGTTIVSAVFYDNKISIAHVGDSRLYRLRNQQLEAITVDHSLIQELIEKGFYTPEEARHSNQKNLVTRALGIDKKVDVEIQEDVVFVGDLFLLCSDGLNDMLEDQQIKEILLQYDDNLHKTVDKLIQRANEMGGRDNISVVLVKINEAFPAKSRWFSWFTDWF